MRQVRVAIPRIGPISPPTPIFAHHEARWENVRTGELGAEFTNSPHSALRFAERLDAGRMGRALTMVLGRHAILRTVVGAVEGHNCYVDSNREMVLDYWEVDGGIDENPALRDAVSAYIWRPFPSEGGEWARFLLVNADDSSLFALCVHHFISDGWSIGILVNELFEAYEVAARDVTLTLRHPGERSGYPAWCVDHSRWLSDPAKTRDHLAFWRTALKEAPGFPFPAASGPDVPEFGEIHQLRQTVPTEVFARVREARARNKFNCHLAVLSAIFAAAQAAGAGDDLTLVNRTSGRFEPRHLNLVGPMFDAVAVRVTGDFQQDPGRVLDQIRPRVLQAFARQKIPFQVVKDTLDEIGASQVAPMINIIDTIDSDEILPGGRAYRAFDINPYPQEVHSVRRYSSFYIALNLGRREMKIGIDYANQLFPGEGVANFADLIIRNLAAMCA